MAVVFVALLSAYHIRMQRKWQEPHRVFAYDIGAYYMYLPAFFVHDDLRLTYLDHTPLLKDMWVPKKGPVGHRVIKMTSGLAILYAPFFLIADVVAPYFGYAANGYTEPYAIALLASSWCYFLLGLYFLARWLRPYGTPLLITATVILIALGNNLYHYSTAEAGMSHTYLFALVALLALLVDGFWHKPTIWRALVIGLVWGCACLSGPRICCWVSGWACWGLSACLHYGNGRCGGFAIGTCC